MNPECPETARRLEEGKDLGGGTIGNKNREEYTLEDTLKLFEEAKNILVKDKDIITDTELQIKCKHALELPISSYQYLRDKKFPAELGDIKKEIDGILEARVMKSKEMYPGISAMTLKNKHKWRDKQEVDLSGGLDIEGIKITLVKPES